MAIREILNFGDPRLQQRCHEVETFGPELAALIEDLRDTCRQARGVGLAAPQIGVLLRVALVDLSGGEDPEQEILLINPRILDSGTAVRGEEGCLSFPGLFTTITRPEQARVEGFSLDGETTRVIEGGGLLARAMLHEIDHLDGVLITDHLRGLKRSLFMKKVAKARKSGAWS